MAEPAAVSIAQSFQNQLRAADADAILSMGKRWGHIEAALSSLIDALANEIAALQAAGQDVPQWKIYEMERYQSLLAQVGAELGKYMQWAFVELKEAGLKAQQRAQENAAEMFSVMGADLDMQDRLKLAFDKLGVEAAEKIAGLAQGGMPLQQILEKAYPTAVNGLTNQLITGTALAKSPRDTAKMMMQGLQQGLNHILLVARDQQIRNYREAQRDAFGRSGLVYAYKRLAARNTRTCMACIAQDGYIYPVGAVMELHPQDRCSMIPLIEGVPVPQWTSAREWFKNQDKDTQREMLGPGKFALWEEGAFNLHQMVTIKPNAVWGPNAQVTTLKDLKAGRGGNDQRNITAKSILKTWKDTKTPTDQAGKAKTIDLGTDPKIAQALSENLGLIKHLDLKTKTGINKALKRIYKDGHKGYAYSDPDGRLQGAISFQTNPNNLQFTNITGIGTTDEATTLKAITDVATAAATSNRGVEVHVPDALVADYLRWGFTPHNSTQTGMVMRLYGKDIGAFTADPVKFGEVKGQQIADDLILNLADKTATATFRSGYEVKGAPFKSVDLADDDFEKHTWQGMPDLPSLKGVTKDIHAAAGMLLIHPETGKMVLTNPAGGFGGYGTTIPKGSQEPGDSLQKTAVKEIYEETGLQAQVVGWLGDYKKTTSMNRFYVGIVTDGAPWDAHWETAAVKFAPMDQARGLMGTKADKKIIKDFLAQHEKALEMGGGDMVKGWMDLTQQNAERAQEFEQVKFDAFHKWNQGEDQLTLNDMQLAKQWLDENDTDGLLIGTIVQEIDDFKTAERQAKAAAKQLQVDGKAALDDFIFFGPDALQTKPMAVLRMAVTKAYELAHSPGVISDLEAIMATRKEAAVLKQPVTYPDDVAEGSKTAQVTWLVQTHNITKWKISQLPAAQISALNGKSLAEVLDAAEAGAAKYYASKAEKKAAAKAKAEYEAGLVHMPAEVAEGTKTAVVKFLVDKTGATAWKLKQLGVAELKALDGAHIDDILAAAEAGGQKYYDAKAEKKAEAKTPASEAAEAKAVSWEDHDITVADRVIAAATGTPLSEVQQIPRERKAERIPITDDLAEAHAWLQQLTGEKGYNDVLAAVKGHSDLTLKDFSDQQIDEAMQYAIDNDVPHEDYITMNTAVTDHMHAKEVSTEQKQADAEAADILLKATIDHVNQFGFENLPPMETVRLAMQSKNATPDDLITLQSLVKVIQQEDEAAAAAAWLGEDVSTAPTQVLHDAFIDSVHNTTGQAELERLWKFWSREDLVALKASGKLGNLTGLVDGMLQQHKEAAEDQDQYSQLLQEGQEIQYLYNESGAVTDQEFIAGLGAAKLEAWKAHLLDVDDWILANQVTEHLRTLKGIASNTPTVDQLDKAWANWDQVLDMPLGSEAEITKAMAQMFTKEELANMQHLVEDQGFYEEYLTAVKGAAQLKSGAVLRSAKEEQAAVAQVQIPEPGEGIKKANQYVEWLVQMGKYAPADILAANQLHFPKSIFTLANVEAKYKKFGLEPPVTWADLDPAAPDPGEARKLAWGEQLAHAYLNKDLPQEIQPLYKQIGTKGLDAMNAWVQATKGQGDTLADALATGKLDGILEGKLNEEQEQYMAWMTAKYTTWNSHELWQALQHAKANDQLAVPNLTAAWQDALATELPIMELYQEWRNGGLKGEPLMSTKAIQDLIIYTEKQGLTDHNAALKQLLPQNEARLATAQQTADMVQALADLNQVSAMELYTTYQVLKRQDGPYVKWLQLAKQKHAFDIFATDGHTGNMTAKQVYWAQKWVQGHAYPDEKQALIEELVVSGNQVDKNPFPWDQPDPAKEAADLTGQKTHDTPAAQLYADMQDQLAAAQGITSSKAVLDNFTAEEVLTILAHAQRVQPPNMVQLTAVTSLKLKPSWVKAKQKYVQGEDLAVHMSHDEVSQAIQYAHIKADIQDYGGFKDSGTYEELQKMAAKMGVQTQPTDKAKAAFDKFQAIAADAQDLSEVVAGMTIEEMNMADGYMAANYDQVNPSDAAILTKAMGNKKTAAFDLGPVIKQWNENKAAAEAGLQSPHSIAFDDTVKLAEFFPELFDENQLKAIAAMQGVPSTTAEPAQPSGGDFVGSKGKPDDEAVSAYPAVVPLPPGTSLKGAKYLKKDDLVAHIAPYTPVSVASLQKLTKAQLVDLMDPVKNLPGQPEEVAVILEGPLALPESPTGSLDITGAKQGLIQKFTGQINQFDGFFKKGGQKAIGNIQNGHQGLVYTDDAGNLLGIISLGNTGQALKVTGAAFSSPEINTKAIADALEKAAAVGLPLETWVPDQFASQYQAWGFKNTSSKYYQATKAEAAALDGARSAEINSMTDEGPVPPPAGVTSWEQVQAMTKKALVDHLSPATGISKNDLNVLDKKDLAPIIGTYPGQELTNKIAAVKELKKKKAPFDKWQAEGVKNIKTSSQGLAILSYIDEAKPKGLAPSKLDDLREHIERLQIEERERSPFTPIRQKLPLPSNLPPAAKMPEHKDFPDDPLKLKRVSGLGGSTGAELVQGPDGRQYVRKKGANPEHVRTEAQTDALYQAAGLKVPRHMIYETAEGPVKLSEFIPDMQDLATALKKSSGAQRKKIIDQVRAGFSVDALTGNWDVMGMSQDNMGVDADGNVWRIDNGGTMRYRAMGGKKDAKDWNGYVTELWSMRFEGSRGGAARHNQHIFGKMGIYEIADQVREWEGKIPEMLASIAPEERQIMNDRMHYMLDMADTVETLGKDRYEENYTDDFMRHSTYIREEGLIDALPKQMKRMGSGSNTGFKDEQGRKWDRWRGRGSHIEAFARWAAANGGDHNIIAGWQSSQGGSSWSGPSQALKYFRAKQRGDNFDDYFWLNGVHTAESKYNEAINKFGDKYEKTWMMWQAFVYESLRQMDFDHKSNAGGYVEIVRTEPNEVMRSLGIKANKKKTDNRMKRGAAESGSIVKAISIAGSALTLQRVPFHRIMGFYWHEQGAGTGGTGFYGDGENEFVFDGEGLDFTYWGVHTGDVDPVWNAWEKSTGEARLP